VNGRYARFEALLPPGVRSLTTSDPGQGEAVAPVLSWASSPLEPSPKRPGSGISPKPHRIRDEPSPDTPRGTQPSRYVRETRIPTPGFMNPGSADARNRSNPHTTVRQRPSSDSRSRRVSAPATSLATSPSRMRPAKRLARAPSRRRPAPPTSSTADSPEGCQPLDLGDTLRWTVCGGPTSCEMDQLFWGFVPRRVGSRVRARSGAWLTRPSSASPTIGSPRVQALRHRSTHDPSWTPSVYSPHPATFAVG